MSQNVLSEASSLPMVLPEPEIIATIDKILAAARSDATLARVDIAETLVDIMGRQSANYRPLDRSLCERIESWALDAWSEDPPPLLDALGAIVLMCDSQRGFDLLRAARTSESAEVRRIANEDLEEALHNGQIASI